MTTVRQILQMKGGGVETIRPEDSVFDAIKKMADKKIGALLVMEDDKVHGIITERHYARNVFLEGKSSPKTRVNEIMTEDVIYANPDLNIDECMAVMINKGVRHLPVRENDQLIGLVTIGDLARAFISEQQFTIDQLHTYISH
jgi:CBS domain-containing protein